MIEASETSRLRRVWNTPMRDWVRLRLTSRMNWRGVIASADIPEPAKALLTKLVRRTHLWRLEKADVARDLVCHFEDALADERPIDEVLESFGDWRRAARLTRRAVKRKRQLLWHAWRWTFWSTLSLVGLYVGLGMYFAVAGERHIATDYAQMVNAQAAAVSEDDRAWPVFRDAMIPLISDPAYQAVPQIDASDVGDEQARSTVEALLRRSMRPGDSAWPRVAAFIESHAADLAQIRDAAAMPGFGFLSTFDHAVEDLPLFAPETDPQQQADVLADVLANAVNEEPRPIIGMLLPHLGYLRIASKCLEAEALLALERGEPQIAYDNIVAIFQLAGHADEHRTLINQLVTTSLYKQGYLLISRVLDDQPDALTDEQVQDLAHRIAALRVYPYDFDAEKMFMLDMIQRVYTDDGHGGGHLNPEGWHEYRTLVVQWEVNGPAATYAVMFDEALTYFTMPAVTLMTAGRREMTEQVQRLYGIYQADLAVPMYQRPESAGDQAVYALIGESALSSMRYPLIAELMPAIGAVRKIKARNTANADGALAALALELYRREQGGYPESLDLLVPRYLPTMPIDRITGKPLNYRVIDDRPVLYSVGADRDDDAGTVVYTPDGDRDRNTSKWVVEEGKSPVDGDWVVWPLHD